MSLFALRSGHAFDKKSPRVRPPRRSTRPDSPRLLRRLNGAGPDHTIAPAFVRCAWASGIRGARAEDHGRAHGAPRRPAELRRTRLSRSARGAMRSTMIFRTGSSNPG